MTIQWWAEGCPAKAWPFFRFFFEFFVSFCTLGRPKVGQFYEFGQTQRHWPTTVLKRPNYIFGHFSIIIKWGASSWWWFGPNSAYGSIETMTIGKTHPTLLKSTIDGLFEFKLICFKIMKTDDFELHGIQMELYHYLMILCHYWPTVSNILYIKACSILYSSISWNGILQSHTVWLIQYY